MKIIDNHRHTVAIKILKIIGAVITSIITLIIIIIVVRCSIDTKFVFNNTIINTNTSNIHNNTREYTTV